MAATLRELTAPVSLTRTDGRLNPAAVGWARQPLVETAGIGRGRGRNKRWEYWGVVTDTHLLGVTVSHIDFAALPEGHERLSVVVPWSETRFQYTVKDVARPASGHLTLDGNTTHLPEGSSWAVLDHGRGRWPHDIRWNWGAGSGTTDGRTIGLQVGGRWTEGTGSTENAMVIDGRLHHIPVELTFDYDIERWQEPWRHRWWAGRDLHPFHLKATHTDLKLLASHTDQCFGRWSGNFTDEEGTLTPFVDLLGWCEEVHNRW